MLSLPVTEAQRVSSLSASVKISFSPSSLRVHFCFHARRVSSLSAFSSARLCRCCTVRRNTELQVDQKTLQHKTAVWVNISFSVSHPTTAAEQKEQSRSAGKRLQLKRRDTKTNTNPCSYPVPADLREEHRKEEKKRWRRKKKKQEKGD